MGQNDRQLGRRLTRAFFQRHSVAVARDLIGCYFTRALNNGGRLVVRIVEVEAYIGENRWSYRPMGKFDHEVKRDKLAKDKRVVVVPDAWEPMVPVDLFNRVQTLISERRRGKIRGKRNVFMLDGGLAVCRRDILVARLDSFQRTVFGGEGGDDFVPERVWLGG